MKVEDRLMDLKDIIGYENIPIRKVNRIKNMLDDCYKEIKKLRKQNDDFKKTKENS